MCVTQEYSPILLNYTAASGFCPVTSTEGHPLTEEEIDTGIFFHREMYPESICALKKIGSLQPLSSIPCIC